MSDIVERLRHPRPEGGGFRLRGEAALEIERLRAALSLICSLEQPMGRSDSNLMGAQRVAEDALRPPEPR